MTRSWPQGRWDEKWKFVNDLGSGGQGTTFRVESTEDGSQGVLKILNEPDDEKCRDRMYQETAALRVLRHRQIARLVDTNANDFETDAELYLVTEYIDGPTLRDAVTERLPSEDEVFKLAFSLCEALDYAHGRPLPVFHRDIKPENIVLRGGTLSDPVLIDFGIAFNAADPDRRVTDTAEKLGNRFLWLPEHQPGSPFKRDHRADLTQVVGVLFFVGTGEDPVMLLDPEERMPHRRPKAKKLLDRIEATKGQILRRAFDTGFRWHIDQRWQSIQALISALEPSQQEEPMNLSELKETNSDELVARDPRYRGQSSFRAARDRILLAIYGPISDLVSELDDFTPIKSAA
jgi:serine/threonine-protein kinase